MLPGSLLDREIRGPVSFQGVLASLLTNRLLTTGPPLRYCCEIPDGIVKLSRIRLTHIQHARVTTGLGPIILGVGPSSFR